MLLIVAYLIQKSKPRKCAGAFLLLDTCKNVCYTRGRSKFNRGRKEKSMDKYRSAISTVAKMLNVERISWSRAVKECRQAMEDGFTLDDFVEATRNMKETDPKYWSMYSIFQKTDYWLGVKPKPQKPKGVW